MPSAKNPPQSPTDSVSTRQRLLLANMDEGFAACEMLYDPAGNASDYRFLEVNQAFEQQTGLRSADILGKTVLELFPDVERTWIERFGKVATTGVSERFEEFNHNTSRHYETFAYSPDRTTVFLLIRDISARKLAEQSVAQSENRLRLALEVGKMAMWNSNYVTGEYVWDQALAHLLGYPPGAKASYERWTRRVHPEDLPMVQAKNLAAARLGGEFQAEYRIFSQNDEIRWVEARGHIEADHQGKIVCSYGVVVDITERKRTEEELRMTTQRFELALRNSPIVVFNQDLDLRYTWIYNPALGYQPEGVLGKRDFDLFENGEDSAILERIKRNVIKSGIGRRQDVIVRSQGVDRCYDLIVDPQRDVNGRIIGVTCAAIDRTESKQAERALLAQRRLTETVVEHIPCCVAMVRGVDLTFQLVNAAYQALAPGKEMVGRTIAEVWPEVDGFESLCRSVCISGKPHHGVDEAAFVSPAAGAPAEIRYFTWSMHPVELPGNDEPGLLIAGWETTARKRAEEAMLRNEKLSSAGRMAASVAHEINNPLEAATNLVFLAASAEDVPGSSREYLDAAQTELNRIAHFTRQSLGFYHESSRPVPVPLTELLRSTIDIYRSKIGSKRASVVLLAPADLEVVAVPGELRQLFSNILANALDAIAAAGAVRIKTSAITHPATKQPCVRVTIADNGEGIPPSALPHLFEPFFSTRDSVGTGLGLWIGKQLADKHGATIRLRSATSGARRGTTVCIRLPFTR